MRKNSPQPPKVESSILDSLSSNSKQTLRGNSIKNETLLIPTIVALNGFTNITAKSEKRIHWQFRRKYSGHFSHTCVPAVTYHSKAENETDATTVRKMPSFDRIPSPSQLNFVHPRRGGIEGKVTLLHVARWCVVMKCGCEFWNDSRVRAFQKKKILINVQLSKRICYDGSNPSTTLSLTGTRKHNTGDEK